MVEAALDLARDHTQRLLEALNDVNNLLLIKGLRLLVLAHPQLCAVCTFLEHGLGSLPELPVLLGRTPSVLVERLDAESGATLLLAVRVIVFT